MRYPSHLITGDTLVISDTHFKHKSINNMEPEREAAAIKLGMTSDEFILHQINQATLGFKDVLFLGDVAFSGIESFFNRINARHKFIILGNHDRKSDYYRKIGVMAIDGVHIDLGNVENGYIGGLSHQSNDPLLSGLIMDIKGKRVMLSHYALFHNRSSDHSNPSINHRIKILEGFYKQFNCQVNIHGHLHQGNSVFKDSINACAVKLNFTPQSLSELIY